MSKRRKVRKSKLSHHRSAQLVSAEAGIQMLYEHASQCAERGQTEEARRIYGQLAPTVTEPRLKSLLCNDRGALAAAAGDAAAARQGFQEALAIDPQCEPARANLALLQEDLAAAGEESNQTPEALAPSLVLPQANAVKVALVSFLFNWPSTGGGIIHTVELARFLVQAGYEVRHFYARYAPWQIGRVEGAPVRSQVLDFDEADWNVPTIQARYRQAVDAFAPDYVLLTDSWNMKPHLAAALHGYPILLRFQALECLCPLNNVRLLPLDQGRWAQCPRHQLATPQECSDCLWVRGRSSGHLHQAERELAGVGTREYYELLCRVLREAEAVLVLNPFTEALLSPYARQVRVVPWGMDPARFPWPADPAGPVAKPIKTIFQAGVVEEPMKGFHVLHAACARLWQKRQDFELVATGDPAGRVDDMTHYTGWVSQEELPGHYRAADIVAVPTVAQEGLSRTSVEAMASGRPVVASRIGGVPSTVLDGATGLLCEPGDAEDLARKLETLLDDADLRQRLGRAGRRRFEEHFSWEVVIERHYRPLLSRPVRVRSETAGSVSSAVSRSA